ncbi:SdpI family protein [Leucobacter sp. HY1908]
MDILLSVISAIPLLIACPVVLWIAYKSSTGTLKKNFWVGIRTTKTVSSDEAWEVGHKAGARWFSLAAYGLLIAGVAVLFTPRDLVLVPVLIGCVWLLICFAIASSKANKAIDDLVTD